MTRVILGAATTALAALAGCPGPKAPSEGAVAAQTLEIGRDHGALAGVASDGAMTFAALTLPGASREPLAAHAKTRQPGERVVVNDAAVGGAYVAIEARDGRGARTWRRELHGRGGAMALLGSRVVTALGGSNTVAGVAMRGEPGAVVVAMDKASGAVAWQLAVDATDWVVVHAIADAPALAAAQAADARDAVIAGTFSGTLRIGAQVVSSAGRSDGFVARVAADGELAWLIRVGGPGADGLQGVAVEGERIAIAGSVSPGADLLGQPLSSIEERLPAGDGLVAELDARGARRWAQTFGSKEDDAIAGVAFDARGRVVVAATVRATVHIGATELIAQGPADGLVAWWTADGSPGPSALLGGLDADGLRAIVRAGDHIVVAGFYAGKLQLGAHALTATGDDAFLLALDAADTGAPTIGQLWPLTGDGREEVAALAPVPGGFIAAIAHTTAATLDGARVPAPADPMSGAALLVRAAR